MQFQPGKQEEMFSSLYSQAWRPNSLFPVARPRQVFDHRRSINQSHSNSQSMNQTPNYVCRDKADVIPWAETCGQIRPLIEEKDGAAAEVHHLEITDAKLHYHERTDEIYYVLGGQGRMRLDASEIELREGVVVYVPRGVKHKAWGNLKVLVVCIPRGVLHDVHEVE